jgi:hypothetical protein
VIRQLVLANDVIGQVCNGKSKTAINMEISREAAGVPVSIIL